MPIAEIDAQSGYSLYKDRRGHANLVTKQKKKGKEAAEHSTELSICSYNSRVAGSNDTYFRKMPTGGVVGTDLGANHQFTNIGELKKLLKGDHHKEQSRENLTLKCKNSFTNIFRPNVPTPIDVDSWSSLETKILRVLNYKYYEDDYSKIFMYEEEAFMNRAEPYSWEEIIYDVKLENYETKSVISGSQTQSFQTASFSGTTKCCNKYWWYSVLQKIGYALKCDRCMHVF